VEAHDMAKRRTEWRQSHGKWTKSLGERGARVRLFQKRRGGVFYRATWIAGARDVRSLETHDRKEAERLGRQLLAALLGGEGLAASDVLSFGALWHQFRESSEFLDNDARTQEDYAAHADVLRAFFGEVRDAATLTGRDQLAFTSARRAGGIRVTSTRIRDGVSVQHEWTTGAVRSRAVEADLVLLHGMLNWATRERRETGKPLLEHNPLRGVRIEREKNPRRPVATRERFERTRTAMQKLLGEATIDTERRRWIKMELALLIAKNTGRRLGSIRQLRWDDVDFEAGTIRWRADTDKKGVEWVVPIPQTLCDELRSFRTRLGVIAGWVFPAEKDAEQPMGRDQFDKFLRIAEAKAELPKLDGGLWHPYRRGWATAKKHLPLADVASAGGWNGVDTLLRCYQQPDNETILAVMSDTREVQMWRGAKV
jgi:integrase